MIYKGIFKDINNIEYTIKITTNGDSSSTTNVVLAATPITTEWETSDSHIYKPAKYSSSTVRILSSDYMFDIYSATAQQNKVELLQGDVTKWVGYTTPNLYSMGYESDIEELEIETIDGLSTLQYYKYTPIGESKGIVKFIDIIDNLLSKCNCYNSYYISNVSVLNGTTDSLIDKCVISENNFFDEDGDAMTCQEVLEHICQFLGLTCIAIGNSVYFLDYDAIKNDKNTYNKYTIGNTSTFTTVTLSQSKAIEGIDYTNNGGQISLDNVYNKVIVKDSLYTFEDVIPNIFDKDSLTNITANSDSTLSSSNAVNNGAYGEIVSGTDGNTIAFIDKVYNEQKDKYKDTCAVGVQYYKNPNYKLYDYTNTSKTNYNYTDTTKMRGAILGKFFVKKLSKSDSDITNDMEQILAGGTTLEKYLAANEISKFDYNDYLVLINNNNHISNDNAVSYPYFETSIDNASSLFGGENAYLLISGSMLFNSTKMGNETYPVPSDCIDPSEGRYHFSSDSMYMLAKLQWGNQYWNGSSWQTNSCTFNIYFSSDETDPRVDACLMKELNIKNTVTWKTGSDKKGYCIKCPSNYLMNGMPKLTVYKPMDFTVKGEGNYYPTSVMFLKNFSIEAFIGDPTFSNDNETDTEYTNVINEDFVEEMDNIEFKICTWDNKAPNYSAVAYINNNNYIYLDTYKHNGTNQLLRAEEHLIYRLVNQYSTPSTVLSLNLKNDINVYSTVTDKWLPNKVFIVDSMSIDWEMNNTNYKLIEKK